MKWELVFPLVDSPALRLSWSIMTRTIIVSGGNYIYLARGKYHKYCLFTVTET